MPDSFPNNTDVKTVSITLDGKTVSVPEGSTIWKPHRAGYLSRLYATNWNPVTGLTAIAVPVW